MKGFLLATSPVLISRSHFGTFTMIISDNITKDEFGMSAARQFGICVVETALRVWRQPRLDHYLQP